MLNLHANPLSPFGQKVHFFMEETGRPYKYNLVDFTKGEHKSPAYLALNPFGKIPAIELDGFGVGESNAIMRYVAQKWQLDGLYPTNLEDRALVDMVMDFTTQHVNQFLNEASWNLTWAPKFGMAANQPMITEAHQRLAMNLPRLERFLSGGRTFLAGANVTIADINLMPFLAQHQYAQVSLSDYPGLHAWLRRMEARPTWRKVMSELERMLPR